MLKLIAVGTTAVHLNETDAQTVARAGECHVAPAGPKLGRVRSLELTNTPCVYKEMSS